MKYTVKMSCGHEETVELFGAGKDRDRKIAYYESQGLCKECYKKMMQEKAKKEGLTFNASVLPYIDKDSLSIMLFVWFDGDTMPHKDEIKALGYHWGEKEAADDWYSARSSKCWGKIIEESELKDEMEKAVSIGAKAMTTDTGLFSSAHYLMALKSQKAQKEALARIAAIEKPVVPEVLKGHKWNQKIYGKAGSYTIYPDSVKTSITDEEAEEIKTYLAAKEEYSKKVREAELKRIEL